MYIFFIALFFNYYLAVCRIVEHKNALGLFFYFTDYIFAEGIVDFG